MARFLSILAALSLAGCSGPPSAEASVVDAEAAGSLTAGDRAALTALDSMVAKAWLLPPGPERDEAVLGQFAHDAVFYPSDGDEPVAGREALREYWFGADRPELEITSFVRHVEAVEGSAALAAIVGTSEVTFLRRGETHTINGQYIIHARRDAAGHWRIIRMLTRSGRKD